MYLCVDESGCPLYKQQTTSFSFSLSENALKKKKKKKKKKIFAGKETIFPRYPFQSFFFFFFKHLDFVCYSVLPGQ